MTDPNTQAVVTQADREAAASVYLASDDTYNADPILHGEWDDTELVQAFARHRLAHTTPPADAEMDALVEALNYRSESSEPVYIHEGDLMNEDGPQAATTIQSLRTKLAEAKARVGRLREALMVLRDLPIVENEEPNTLHLKGEPHRGPVVDWTFSIIRKVKGIARAALTDAPAKEGSDA